MERIRRAVRSVLKYLKDSGGATLYETTAAVAMAGILAAVAAPVIIERVGEAKVARAVAEIDTIWAGMQNFQRDTGKMPGEAEGVFLLFTGPPGQIHAPLPDV
ncbi:MAG: type II secretion system protein GspG, partial [Candidatus Rokubacteria bacterium]|nr:type II secretion system protein GspG [Candidatus Rokubacteria bacterium]